MKKQLQVATRKFLVRCWSTHESVKHWNSLQGHVTGDIKNLSRQQLEQPDVSCPCFEWWVALDDLQRPFAVHVIILQYEIIRYKLDTTITEAGFRTKELNKFSLKQREGTKWYFYMAWNLFSSFLSHQIPNKFTICDYSRNMWFHGILFFQNSFN